MEKLKFEIKQIINATSEKVWHVITKNEEIQKWFPEMSYHENKELGYFRWHDVNIDLKLNVIQKIDKQLIAFEWAGNTVHLNLISKGSTTEFVFCETLSKIIEHTPKDLAGWFVCIEKIRRQAEMSDEEVDAELWKSKFEEYQALLGITKI